MKKIAIVMLGIILKTSSLSAQSSYTIKGSIPSNIKAVKAVLSYPPDEGFEYISDTAKVVNGEFEFRGKVRRPQLAEVNLIQSKPVKEDAANNMKNVALVYSDGDIRITFDKDGMAAYQGGNIEQKYWEKYQKKLLDEQKKLGGKQIEMSNILQVINDFVLDNPDCYVSVDLIDIFVQGAMQPRLVKPMYDALSSRMKNEPKVIAWKKRLDDALVFQSGTIKAQDFTMNDANGNPVTLSKYKGQYVLLDFWASWCVPCRAENPNVLAAYNKFKGKNFTILAVSLDEKKADWLKAIKEDKLPWLQLCDLKGGENAAAVLYKVSMVPDNFLIDPNGNIVDRGLRGEELEKRLSELLK
ncbi:TlpA disulfide reductase family protein [Flavobacterium ajazii]|uniref:TlpA disulfide reductase family protein n=1 Tax=Flavobacterium ajazii TaxID=2692318 RepID=UPI0013D32BDE|nr:TlpA disulfide reductase family protein [Flavobacterium ajazii]